MEKQLQAQLLDVNAVSQLTGLRPTTLRVIARRGDWPDAVVRVPGSRTIRFRRAVVERYLTGDSPSAA